MANHGNGSGRNALDFLYTYRGLLLDFDGVQERYVQLLEAKSVEDRSALTQSWIKQATGGEPSVLPLSTEQNDAFYALLADRRLFPIMPWAAQPSPGPAGASDDGQAPTLDELRIIYRAMFASNDVNMSTAQFAKFELAAHAGRFSEVEMQFTELYRRQTGQTRAFQLSEPQRQALKVLTLDTYLPLSPFVVERTTQAY